MEFSDITLSWEEFCWEGELAQLPFRRISCPNVELTVHTKDEQEMPPCQQQLYIWQELLRERDHYEDLVLSGLLAWYAQTRTQVQARDPDLANVMPIFATAQRLAARIELGTVNISWPYDQPPTLDFTFGCDWEDEHGLGIVFRERKQVKVGLADCAY